MLETLPAALASDSDNDESRDGFQIAVELFMKDLPRCDPVYEKLVGEKTFKLMEMYWQRVRTDVQNLKDTLVWLSVIDRADIDWSSEG